mmetsp:Transcript_6993/g.16146  ORF Transcript_6993/g.16146 Transcript_6993/m.16146 type:complete len:138 (-) Transcript_6993:19-432(-)
MLLGSLLELRQNHRRYLLGPKLLLLASPFYDNLRLLAGGPLDNFEGKRLHLLRRHGIRERTADDALDIVDRVAGVGCDLTLRSGPDKFPLLGEGDPRGTRPSGGRLDDLDLARLLIVTGDAAESRTQIYAYNRFCHG